MPSHVGDEDQRESDDSRPRGRSCVGSGSTWRPGRNQGGSVRSHPAPRSVDVVGAELLEGEIAIEVVGRGRAEARP